jgi:hypothetical protein
MLQSNGVAEYEPLLTIIAPAFNEQDVLPDFHRRVTAVLDELAMPAEISRSCDGLPLTTGEWASLIYQETSAKKSL